MTHPVERVAQAPVQMTPAPCREQKAVAAARVQQAVLDQRPALEPRVVEAAQRPEVAPDPGAAAVVSRNVRVH